ncbi:MAG: helix-turn-helix domain-containing protein [Chthoniobacterales bacterium]
MKIEKDDNFISLKKAAGKLDVCARTIRRMCQKGELPPIVKIGKLSKLPESAILNYMQRKLANH